MAARSPPFRGGSHSLAQRLQQLDLATDAYGRMVIAWSAGDGCVQLGEKRRGSIDPGEIGHVGGLRLQIRLLCG